MPFQVREYARYLLFILFSVFFVSSGRPAQASDVMLETGGGPSLYTWLGSVGAEQPLHTGVVVTADVVLDRAAMQSGENVGFSSRYGREGRVGAVHIRPYWYAPESVILSPRYQQTGMVGLSWAPLQLGFTLIEVPAEVRIIGDVRITAMYMWSDSLPSPRAPRDTFFFRPGVSIGGELRLPLSDKILVRLASTSETYIPQGIGTFGVGRPGERMVMALRQTAELRFRIPRKARWR